MLAIVSSSRDAWPGKYPDCSPHAVAKSPVVMSSMNSNARSWSSAVENMLRCEPPSTDGLIPPSLPGIGTAANLPSMSALASTIAPGVQEPMSAMPTSPFANASRTSVSRHVVAPAEE